MYIYIYIYIFHLYIYCIYAFVLFYYFPLYACKDSCDLDSAFVVFLNFYRC